ncbi:MAG: hypothetical protein U0359_39780 [Byssovorax sp.]
MLRVQAPERGEHRLHHGEPVRAVAMGHRREDGQLDLLLGHDRINDLGNGGRA